MMPLGGETDFMSVSVRYGRKVARREEGNGLETHSTEDGACGERVVWRELRVDMSHGVGVSRNSLIMATTRLGMASGFFGEAVGESKVTWEFFILEAVTSPM
jgi:hypothetical protein